MFEEVPGGSVGLLLSGMGEVCSPGPCYPAMLLKHLSVFPKAPHNQTQSLVTEEPWCCGFILPGPFPSSLNCAALTIWPPASMGPPWGFFLAPSSTPHQGWSRHPASARVLVRFSNIKLGLHPFLPQILSWTRLVRLFSWSVFSILSQNWYWVGLTHVFYGYVDTYFVEEIKFSLYFWY